MTRRFRLLVTAGIGVGYPLLLVFALVPAPGPFTVVLAAVLALEVWLALRFPYALPDVLTRQLSVGFRIFSADVLAAVLAARVVDHRAVTVLTLLAVFALLGARDAVSLLDRRIRWLAAGGPVGWRNLTVPTLPVPRVREEDPALDWQATLPSLLLPIGATLSQVLDSYMPLLVAALALLAGVVVLLAVRVAQWRRREHGGPAVIRLAVREAILAYAPEVVLHYSGRRRTTEQAEMWMSSLGWLRQRAIVFVREPHHLETLAAAGLPVVFAPASTDVELFSVETIRVALYPTNTANINNHQIRVPGIFDVMVGTGDSDEPHNSSPMSRIFDQIWVAGPLGRARYASPVAGVRDEAIREIGALPMVARSIAGSPALPSAAPDGRRTIVYAPSWESTQDRANLSSLSSATALLRDLLVLPDTRVLYASPAAAGTRLPEYADFDAAARALIDRVGAPHETIDRRRAAVELAHAALVVCDVSTVIADALLLDVPYAVPALPGWSEERMRLTFPTLAAGSVIAERPLADALGDALADTAGDGIASARAGTARQSDARAALSHDVLGRSRDAFQQRFQSAIDEAVALQAERRSHERPPVA